MKLVLKNIGKVQNATVEINGITVIAGERYGKKYGWKSVVFCV